LVVLTQNTVACEEKSKTSFPLVRTRNKQMNVLVSHMSLTKQSRPSVLKKRRKALSDFTAPSLTILMAIYLLYD